MKEKLKNIGEFIINSDSDDELSFLLSNGKIGKSLFLYHCGNYLKDEKFKKYSYLYFEESFLALNDYGNNLIGKTLYGGYTGILWLYQYYINVGFIEFDDDAKNIFNLFDELIRKEFFIEKISKNYDLLYGLLGYGVYFLERNKFTTQKEKLDEIVDILYEISIKKEYGIVWEDMFDKSENEKKELINLGFAHGIPSIIVFLSYVYKGTNNKKALFLIDESINFFKHQELDIKTHNYFPSNIIDNQPNKNPSRLAWCYGDLGIGYAILKTGVLLSNNDYISYGKKVLINQAKKTMKDKTTLISDVGFCHGTAGVSHLFNKSYKYSQEEIFYKSSTYWIKQTLNMINKDGSCTRYNYINDERKWDYEISNGLLEGGSGVGLCMLSNLNPNITDWDLCFLL